MNFLQRQFQGACICFEIDLCNLPSSLSTIVQSNLCRKLVNMITQAIGVYAMFDRQKKR